MSKKIKIAIAIITMGGLLYWASGEVGWKEVGRDSEMDLGVPYLHEIDEVFVYMVLLESGPIALKTDDPHPKACEIRWSDEVALFGEPCLGSQYELDGSYRLGPSPRSMDHYLVRINNGFVQVRLNSVTLGEEHE